ncbi:hypothetical protein [Budvicia diplopodorum]|uniref:hypothetical protein n=1 Tax=Budvicia diplopodorum TaxID=1119056 RepID=UPI00135C80B7|nr:hypothetical protein [Budvicia diplopodorum]
MNLNIDIDWQYVASGPLWLRHLIPLLAGLILIAAVLYLYIMPARADNQDIDQQIQAAEQMSASYEQQLAALPLVNQLKQQIQALKEQQKIYRYSSSAAAKLTSAITDYVAVSGGQLIDLKRESGLNKELNKADANVMVYRWRLNMKATYFQFFEFTRLINQGVLLLTIDSLAMSTESERLNLTMNLSLYQLKMEYP